MSGWLEKLGLGLKKSSQKFPEELAAFLPSAK